MPQSVVVVSKVMSGTEAERLLTRLEQKALMLGLGAGRRFDDAVELDWQLDHPRAVEETERLLGELSDTWSVHVAVAREG